MASVPKIGIESNTFGARAVRGRILGAATAAILGLTTVQVVSAPVATLPQALAETRTITDASQQVIEGSGYGTDDPRSVDWAGIVNADPTLRFGQLRLNMSQAQKLQIVDEKAGQYGPFPYPFNNGTAVGSNLGTWNWSGAPDDLFTLTWQPKRGYIGAAPPLPVQIYGTNPPKFDFLNLTTSSTSSSWPR